MRRCPEQASNRHDRAAFAEQEQGVSATTDAGIGIGAGQLTQCLLLCPEIQQHGSTLREWLPLYPGPELLSIRLASPRVMVAQSAAIATASSAVNRSTNGSTCSA